MRGGSVPTRGTASSKEARALTKLGANGDIIIENSGIETKKNTKSKDITIEGSGIGMRKLTTCSDISIEHPGIEMENKGHITKDKTDITIENTSIGMTELDADSNINEDSDIEMVKTGTSTPTAP